MSRTTMSFNVLFLYTTIEMMQQFEKRKKTSFGMNRMCSNPKCNLLQQQQ